MELQRHIFWNLCACVKLCAGLAAVFLCFGCGWFAGEISDKEVDDLHKDMRAQKRTTIFDQSLRDLGQLLRAYYVPVTPIQSKNIGNQTGEQNVPGDLYTMVASAVNKIGPQVIFVPYDAQYVISESSTGGTISRLYPVAVISGGITGFDKDMFEKEREMEAAGGWAGAQGGGHIKASGQYSRVTVDLNMLDYKTQAYFPGVIASNAIVLERSSLGWGVYGYYMGNGAAFDYELKKKQGVHAALRTLVEFSLIELLGKHFQVPYWRVIPGANKDDAMIAGMREAFMDLSGEQQGRTIKKFLFLHGVNGLDREDHVFKGTEEGALKEAMRRYKVNSMADLYIALWSDVPVQTAAMRVGVDRRRQAETARKRAEEEDIRVKQAAAEEENRQLEARKEHERKVEEFKRQVAEGDRLNAEGRLADAENHYTEAHKLFPGEPHPVNMLNAIKALQAKRQAEAEAMKSRLVEADKLYDAAERADFNFVNYRKAMKAYEDVLGFRPGDKYVLGRIALIKNKLSKYSTVVQTGSEGAW